LYLICVQFVRVLFWFSYNGVIHLGWFILLYCMIVFFVGLRSDSIFRRRYFVVIHYCSWVVSQPKKQGNTKFCCIGGKYDIIGISHILWGFFVQFHFHLFWFYCIAKSLSLLEYEYVKHKFMTTITCIHGSMCSHWENFDRIAKAFEMAKNGKSILTIA